MQKRSPDRPATLGIPQLPTKGTAGWLLASPGAPHGTLDMERPVWQTCRTIAFVRNSELQATVFCVRVALFSTLCEPVCQVRIEHSFQEGGHKFYLIINCNQCFLFLFCLCSIPKCDPTWMLDCIRICSNAFTVIDSWWLCTGLCYGWVCLRCSGRS